MSATLQDVFADTAYAIALVIKQDQYHDRAQQWSLRISGRIITTVPVLLETANALSRPAWRKAGMALIDHLQQRQDVEIVKLSEALWRRGWERQDIRGGGRSRESRLRKPRPPYELDLAYGKPSRQEPGFEGRLRDRMLFHRSRLGTVFMLNEPG